MGLHRAFLLTSSSAFLNFDLIFSKVTVDGVVLLPVLDTGVIKGLDDQQMAQVELDLPVA